jgi:hypothetical protein
MKPGDLVKLKKDVSPQPSIFVVYKIYRDYRVDVVFLANETGRHGAFSKNELTLISAV